MLAALLASGARFLVVGAHALAVHGVPRATGNLDVWVLPDSANAERVRPAGSGTWRTWNGWRSTRGEASGVPMRNPPLTGPPAAH